MRKWYQRYIIEKGKETFLYAFIAFGISVGISRLIALDIEKRKSYFWLPIYKRILYSPFLLRDTFINSF